ncbi:MAG: bifunctional 5,10-methylenetetrahydrofolate dehydrogenase/5,10-methenyltetrahydrofolate cyclohydrolase [Alphaproteobacteria bacterium]|nr:bifunctional 5,10-methylenetetrahydrofolate dehydrogenase/5,10-methenyltetrahydrofolate cyclohydrolase [Alphaproteobacteria bacterium]
MTAQILDGKAAAQALCDQLQTRIAKLKENCRPRLAVVLVGDDEASHIYVRNKQKKAASVGIDCQVIELADGIGENALLSIIDELNRDSHTHGIIVQLPLPRHLDELKIISAISPDKDVDGFTPYNTGLMCCNHPQGFISATPLGVLKLLETTQVDLRGKHAVVIGRSNIVGKPMARLLLNRDCTVTITHSHSVNLPAITRQADILVSACGQPKMITSEWIKEGAIVLDVGITRFEGNICGDVDFDDVKNKASFITPVPGGVGPMTIACLLSNTLEAFLRAPECECSAHHLHHSHHCCRH